MWFSWLHVQHKGRLNMAPVTRKSLDHLPPISPTRRHFIGIVAAGAGRLSTIAISSALLTGINVNCTRR
jgi:hypothetical protein